MTLKITGMGCMHCVKKVTDALQAVGANVVKCEIGSAEIEDGFDRATAEAAIRSVGFDPVEEAVK